MKYGIFHQPALGEEVNGDAFYIKEFDHIILLAAIDGLGHGPGAYEASQKAVQHIANNFRAALEDLAWGCHKSLSGSRGAVLGLAKIDVAERQLEWTGVGNIVLRIVRGYEVQRPISMNGIVGANMRKVRKEILRYEPGDLILLYTDGIADKFFPDFPVTADNGLQAMADDIGSRFLKRNDDATLIVAR